MQDLIDDLSQTIKNYRGGIFQNPYQGKDKKVVFVCSMGILRSATGARIYANKYNTRTAGTWKEALIPLSDNLMVWADELVFVNQHNYDQVIRYLEENDEPLCDVVKRKSKVLDIPDHYEHMHPELIKAFEEQYERIER